MSWGGGRLCPLQGLPEGQRRPRGWELESRPTLPARSWVAALPLPVPTPARGPKLRSNRAHLCLAGQPALTVALLHLRSGSNSGFPSEVCAHTKTLALVLTWPNPASRGWGQVSPVHSPKPPRSPGYRLPLIWIKCLRCPVSRCVQTAASSL